MLHKMPSKDGKAKVNGDTIAAWLSENVKLGWNC